MIRLDQNGLDEEHQEFLNFLAKIKNDKKDIDNIVNKFIDYVTFHFQHEEQYMIKVNYPEDYFDAHVKEHLMIKTFVAQYINKDIDNTKIDLLRGMFIYHIENYDKMIENWME